MDPPDQSISERRALRIAQLTINLTEVVMGSGVGACSLAEKLMVLEQLGKVLGEGLD